jgi:outer membrane protein assembly factor BamB
MYTDPLSIIQQKIIGDGNVIGDDNIVNVTKQIQIDLNLTFSTDDLQHLIPAIKDLEIPEEADQSSACKWYYPSEEGSIAPIRAKGVTDNKKFYAADKEGWVYCLCLHSGQEVEMWERPKLPDSIEGGMVLADLQQGQQVLLVPCCDGNLYLLDPTKGKIIDRYQTNGKLKSAPLVTPGSLYLGCTVRKDWGGVVALRLRDGSLIGKWNAPSKKGVRGTPSVVRGMLYFAILDWNGETVFQSDAQRDNVARLIFQTQGMISASPVVDKDRRRIYLACEDNFVYAINFTGRKVWKQRLKHPTRCTGTIDDNRFYIGDEGGCLYALDLDRRGDWLWSWTPDTNGAITATPVICNEAVFFGSRDGNVYSIDSSTGDLLGEFATEGKIIRALLATDDDIIIVGCDQGNRGILYALHWHLGELTRAAQHLEAHKKWIQAAALWMKKGNQLNAVRCYQESKRYKLAALVAEHYSSYKDAAVNYELSAAKAERIDEQAELYWRASENWAKLKRIPEARRCLREKARVQNAPFLNLTLENHIYHVKAEKDIVMQFKVENGGFSSAREISVHVIGDVWEKCKGSMLGILERGESRSVKVRGIVPTTKGKSGGRAEIEAYVSYGDKYGNLHKSVSNHIEFQVSAG